MAVAAPTREMTTTPSDEMLVEMFTTLMRARKLDERCWLLHRQGKIAFHISGMGHEAAQIAVAFAMRRGHDLLNPYYRDMSMVIALGMAPRDILLGVFGRQGDPRTLLLQTRQCVQRLQPGRHAGAASSRHGAGGEIEGRRSRRRHLPGRRLD
jgi:TPP-dependent pyruvate/acetoin dehydrogenase alpha subunit